MKTTADDFDRLLRDALPPAPELRFSAGFDAALRRRLAGRRRDGEARRRRFGAALLAVYGTFAALVSVWVLAGIDWPASPLGGGFGVAAALAALLSPLLLHRANPLAPPGAG